MLNDAKSLNDALEKLLNKCWITELVPEDWRKGVIVKLPKTGNLSECGNWRGITLLSIPGKILCSVMLQRLQDMIDDRLREEQSGFRKGRSCCEQMFTLRNIIEQCVEFQKPLHINFIDFKTAFDSIHPESIWKIAHLYGIPEKFIKIFKNIYLNSTCCKKTEEGFTDKIEFHN